MGLKHSIAAFLIIGASGTLLHFVYGWTGENPLAGVFSAVNESVWEHLKLLFFPSVIFFAVDYLALRCPDNYIAARTVGLFAGMLSIVVIFYTYTGILGFHLSVVDILLFFVGLFVELYVSGIIIRNRFLSGPAAAAISLIALTVMTVCFAVWSFSPPRLGLFRDYN